MRLKQIRLAGFKSFVDRTTIPFPTDMTAIVGPNGCGKSNVIDAVRWVLGESNARHLRGGAMTDVIFNGSTKRAAVSKAMVELIFDNQQGRIGGEYASYSEIAVRREVTRDGQNIYLLNGAKCRKRDITDLFLGTGLGPRSYAIIEQGMISRLIESKPQELRVFIEEAAGVSKYKERRRETELRIKHTDENILRLRDIESELGQQVNKLKTQAQAAKRYRQYRARHRELKALMCLQELRQLDASIDGSSETNAQAEQLQRVEEHSITQAENQLTILANNIAEQQELVQRLQQQSFELRTELAKLEQQQLHTQQQQNQSEQSRIRNTQQQHEIKQNLDDLAEQLAVEQEALLEQQEQLALQQQVLLELEPQLEDAEQNSASKREQQASNLAASQQARHAIEQLQAQLRHSQQMQQRHQQQIAQLQQQLSGLASNNDTVVEELSSKLSAAEPQLQVLEQTLEELERAKLVKQSELQSSQQQRQQLSLQYTAEQTRLQGVDKLLAQVETSATHPLIDVLRVKDGWQLAADAVLAKWLQAEWCETLEPNFPLALCPPLHGGEVSFAAELTHLQSLAQQLEQVDLSYLCGQVLVVDSLEEAFGLREHLSAEQSLITANGEWLGRYWQQLSPPSYQHSLLSLQQERSELSAKLTELNVAKQQFVEQQTELEAEQSKITQQNTRASSDLQQLQNKLSDWRSRLALLQQQQAFAQQQREQLEQQIEDLAINLEQDQESQLQLEEQLDTQLEASQDEQHQQQMWQEQAEQAASLVKQLRASFQQQQSASHQLQLAIGQQQAKCQTQLQQQSYQQQKLQDLALQLSLEPEEHNEQLELLAEQIEQLLEQSLLLEEQQTEASEIHQQSLTQQQAMQQQLKEAQVRLKQLLEQGTEQRIQQQSLLARRTVLLEQLAEQGDNLKHLELSLPEASLEEDYAAELDQVDARLKRMGAVNLAAEEEFDQQNARYQELTAQLTDLEAAIEVLRAAIAKIDRQTRSKFSETFAKVDADLQELFPKVFGGGNAWLELSSDDLLETGVTIMARPPGKKNASISLLSGGEKALTALALVFAIFRLNPAPFCMLDEVDAPLDEVNVGRFADLVHSMSDTVQFIFISHNKVTMEKASQLAGVTMQEPGVSRLVAVDIAEAIAMVE
ncbi:MULTISPECIES: chromosome segregation protein SMC [unclassified Agarivorans]|uniref:chromosome segregation protein SMC n=1 Tax=unclassified Agarivorans TaxID=2636026 RepID=UPI0026E41739|nr:MULTISPECIES: chromosome segregation protein SMC [unclassified Agarivorans]MDO6687992.1 chromosome segregation protein SMC [Agarivorans sp. 3_MG-2023]MDO6717591.1 chromosome segregation protein SMC [Agarivorans sp. 2_MG-2023]